MKELIKRRFVKRCTLNVSKFNAETDFVLKYNFGYNLVLFGFEQHIWNAYVFVFVNRILPDITMRNILSAMLF